MDNAEDDVLQDPVSVFLVLDTWPTLPRHPLQTQTLNPNPNPNHSSSSFDTHLLGFILANIVGNQYYTGRINGREMVALVREPLNPYDPNAIKVVNISQTQVGHIEKGIAKVLSPLIDQNLITIEGIVPKLGGGGGGGRRRNNNVAVRHKIPCQVHIFTRFDAFERVKHEISQTGLQLILEPEGGFSLSEAVVVDERKGGGEERSLDQIFKLVDENVSKKGALEPMEPNKDVIKSELFKHQKEGLRWLVRREVSDEMPPFWEEKDGSFLNQLTNYKTHVRPEPLRGGILADDMGLGKTLTLLSLIAFDKCGSGCPAPPAWVGNGSENCGSDNKLEETRNMDEELSVSGGYRTKRGRLTFKNSCPRKKQKVCEDASLDSFLNLGLPGIKDKSSYDLDLRTTLVVCPPSVFSTWVTQLHEHTKPGSLKMYIYYGDRTREAEVLRKYDIVLTTYSTLATEEPWLESPLKMMEWWRVILDEAHIIKNSNAQMSKAVTNLKSKRRWIVTGTPIQNGTYDLFSLMAFLQFEPFSIRPYWQSLVHRPLSQGTEEGLLRLQVLMATISLRRMKDKTLIGLPNKSVETCLVELSVEERELYDWMEGEARSVVRNYIDDGSVMRNYSTVLSIILRLRQICANVALCPADLRSLLPSDDIEDVSNNPDLLKKMVSALQDGEDFDCPICIAPPNDVVITCCAHIFCRACILKTLKRTKPSCPLCRHHLTQADLFSAPPESSDPDKTISLFDPTSSSKVSALLKLLLASREENPNRKSVIFSQFRKMLMLIEEPLKKAGFKILRLDGSMNAKKRAQVIEEFGETGPMGHTVLLASLKASSSGINLTAASRVYLLEPWWNPAVEEQAMDRVHRIGQKEDVKIVRLIAKNSIEERVLELQEKKKKLAREAFGKRDAKDRREVNIDDLRTLMSL